MTITIPKGATDDEIRQIIHNDERGVCIYCVCRNCGFFLMSMTGAKDEIEIMPWCSHC